MSHTQGKHSRYETIPVSNRHPTSPRSPRSSLHLPRSTPPSRGSSSSPTVLRTPSSSRARTRTRFTRSASSPTTRSSTRTERVTPSPAPSAVPSRLARPSTRLSQPGTSWARSASARSDRPSNGQRRRSSKKVVSAAFEFSKTPLGSCRCDPCHMSPGSIQQRWNHIFLAKRRTDTLDLGWRGREVILRAHFFVCESFETSTTTWVLFYHHPFHDFCSSASTAPFLKSKKTPKKSPRAHPRISKAAALAEPARCLLVVRL